MARRTYCHPELNLCSGGRNEGNGTIDVINTVITGNNIGIRVGSAGSTVKMTGNKFFANNTSTSVVGGGTLATGGDNKVDPIGAVPGVALPNQ